MSRKSWLIVSVLSGLVLILGLIYFFQPDRAEQSPKTENTQQQVNGDANNQAPVPTKGAASRESQEDESAIEEPAAELSVSGISLGSSVEKVMEVFGKPIRKERIDVLPSSHSDTTLIYIDKWVYEKVEFTFATIMEKGASVPEKPPIMTCLATSDAKYKTNKGIGIGDTVETVMQQYGAAEPEEGFYTYCTDELGYQYIKFKVENGKVSLINYISDID